MKFLEVEVFKDDKIIHRDYVGPTSGPSYADKVREYFQAQYPDAHVRLYIRLLKQIGFPVNET